MFRSLPWPDSRCATHEYNCFIEEFSRYLCGQQSNSILGLYRLVMEQAYSPLQEHNGLIKRSEDPYVGNNKAALLLASIILWWSRHTSNKPLLLGKGPTKGRYRRNTVLRGYFAFRVCRFVMKIRPYLTCGQLEPLTGLRAATYVVKACSLPDL